MLSKNLMEIPTEQEIYDRLNVMPCHVSFKTKEVYAQADKKAVIRGKVVYGDLEPEQSFNALSVFIEGTHAVSFSPNANYVRVICDGDNKFAIDITKRTIDGKVELVTSINDGTSAHFNKAIDDYKADSPVANETVIKQVFRVISSDLDAVLESAEIIHDGYNKVGMAIPTFAHTNILSNQLGRLYSTSSFVKKNTNDQSFEGDIDWTVFPFTLLGIMAYCYFNYYSKKASRKKDKYEAINAYNTVSVSSNYDGKEALLNSIKNDLKEYHLDFTQSSNTTSNNTPSTTSNNNFTFADEA